MSRYYNYINSGVFSLACFSSNPAHNHTEPITGLDVHLKLCLFVSCGHDCTVRVWSEDNHILRYPWLHLHASIIHLIL